MQRGDAFSTKLLQGDQTNTGGVESGSDSRMAGGISAAQLNVKTIGAGLNFLVRSQAHYLEKMSMHLAETIEMTLFEEHCSGLEPEM